MHSPAQGNTRKFIIAGIIGALALAIAYGAIGAFSSAGTFTASSESDDGEVVMHTHSTLKIIIEGKSVTVPANIGVNPALYKNHDLDAYGMKSSGISPLHTLDSSGVIHIESTKVRGFDLGEFFEVWGVAFNENCVMDKCGYGTDTVRMYVDGKERNEFRQHIFMDGETIEIVLLRPTP